MFNQHLIHFSQVLIATSIFIFSLENIYIFGHSYLNKKLVIANYVKLIFALLALTLYSPYPIWALLLLNFFQFVELEGTTNGASDHLVNLHLFTLGIYLSTSNELIRKITLMYFTFQLILSYVVPGIYKLKNKNWRIGNALMEISSGNNYCPPVFIKKALSNYSLRLFLSIFIIAIEILFPLIILKKITLYFFIFGIGFHLINFYILRLNRFFLAWVATYPLIAYTLTILPSTN